MERKSLAELVDSFARTQNGDVQLCPNIMGYEQRIKLTFGKNGDPFLSLVSLNTHLTASCLTDLGNFFLDAAHIVEEAQKAKGK